MSKEIDEIYKQYSARIMELDDTPLFASGTFGTFRILSVEEYEKIQKQISVLEKQRNNYRHKRNEYRNKVRVLQKQLATMEKAMENAIVPKFKIGQECYAILGKDIESVKVEKVIATIGKLENETFTFYSITDSDGYACRTLEEQLFATKKEAKAKLRSLKDGCNRT